MMTMRMKRTIVTWVVEAMEGAGMALASSFFSSLEVICGLLATMDDAEVSVGAGVLVVEISEVMEIHDAVAETWVVVIYDGMTANILNVASGAEVVVACLAEMVTAIDRYSTSHHPHTFSCTLYAAIASDRVPLPPRFSYPNTHSDLCEPSSSGCQSLFDGPQSCLGR